MPVTAINSYSEFNYIINSGEPVIIDYWAPWCGPCRFISPVFEEFSDFEDFGNIGFYKVDVDEQEQIAEETGIRAMPTFTVFKNGNKVDELSGADPRGLENLIRRAASL